MKIKFLGTAAAEGIPALSCGCETCKRAKKLGGRNLRSRSQALINNDLLIDFNADTYWHMVKYDIELENINHVLITHSHQDHLQVKDIEYFRPDFCHGRKESINFYSAISGYNLIKQEADMPYMQGSVKYHLVEPYNDYLINGYKIKVLKANHAEFTTPVFYLIEKDNKKLLYAHDTGIFCQDTINYIGGRVDFITMDCTGGLQKGWRDNHLCLETNLEMIEILKSRKIVDNKTIKVVNHFSHNGQALYDDIVKELKGTDIICSYDGLEIEF
ncbi:MAG: MBL fold metallo-hydrolase [Clostridia bacterium]|nr:MBL fold metallo-hydrolase [Clostridia bacterium]